MSLFSLSKCTTILSYPVKHLPATSASLVPEMTGSGFKPTCEDCVLWARRFNHKDSASSSMIENKTATLWGRSEIKYDHINEGRISSLQVLPNFLYIQLWVFLFFFCFSVPSGSSLASCRSHGAVCTGLGVRAGAEVGPPELPSIPGPRIFLTAWDSGTALVVLPPGILPSHHPAEILSPELTIACLRWISSQGMLISLLTVFPFIFCAHFSVGSLCFLILIWRVFF